MTSSLISIVHCSIGFNASRADDLSFFDIIFSEAIGKGFVCTVAWTSFRRNCAHTETGDFVADTDEFNSRIDEIAVANVAGAVDIDVADWQ